MWSFFSLFLNKIRCKLQRREFFFEKGKLIDFKMLDQDDATTRNFPNLCQNGTHPKKD